MYRALSLLLIVLLSISAGCTGITDSSEDEVQDQIFYREPYPLAFHTSFYAQGIPDITFVISNPGNDDKVVRTSAWYDEYSSMAMTTATIDPGDTVEIETMIVLNEEKIRSLTTTTLFNLGWIVEEWGVDGWFVVEEGTAQIEVYPMDTMVWSLSDGEGGVIDTMEYIAVFVTPQAPEVRELLVTSKEYVDQKYDSRYTLFGMNRVLAGYQFGDMPEEFRQIHTDLHAKAVYNALKYSYNVSYLNMIQSFSTSAYVQRVNTPEESLRSTSANCVDGSVLFASALEAMGIRPYIVSLPDHVYVAWKHDTTPAILPGYPNPDGLAVLTPDDITALETTLIGTADFEDAVADANEQIRKDWGKFNHFDDSEAEDYQMVDILYARWQGVYPLK